MSTSTDLDGRYGAPSPTRRRTVIAVSGIVGAIALGWVIWAACVQGTPQVQSSLRTFDVVDAHSVRATIAVKTRSAGVRASCLVRATAADHSVVGERAFAVVGTGKSTTHRVTLRTERMAVAVDLQGCTAPGQKRPR